MSLKRIPSVGKSLMSRIFALRSAMFIARLYYYALNAAARKTRRRCARVTLDGRSRENHRRGSPARAVAQPTNFPMPIEFGAQHGTQLALQVQQDSTRDTHAASGASPAAVSTRPGRVRARLEARFQKPSTGSGLKHA